MNYLCHQHISILGGFSSTEVINHNAFWDCHILKDTCSNASIDFVHMSSTLNCSLGLKTNLLSAVQHSG